jgi:hypothetical protein
MSRKPTKKMIKAANKMIDTICANPPRWEKATAVAGVSRKTMYISDLEVNLGELITAIKIVRGEK